MGFDQAPETKHDAMLWHNTADGCLYMWSADEQEWDNLGPIDGERARDALFYAGAQWTAEQLAAMKAQ